jgi:predicted acylesterase/phospholipase RssA
LVASAIVATAGVPGLIAPTVLMEKDPETGQVAPQPDGEAYIDGSIVHDIPSVGLKEAFNARFVVASQVCARKQSFNFIHAPSYTR